MFKIQLKYNMMAYNIIKDDIAALYPKGLFKTYEELDKAIKDRINELKTTNKYDI